jgi:hypothetical protein
MKENVHISNFLIILFIDQIQCQNAKIKMFDSSLINIDMHTNEHLIYQKTMVWMRDKYIVFKNIYSFVLVLSLIPVTHLTASLIVFRGTDLRPSLKTRTVIPLTFNW